MLREATKDLGRLRTITRIIGKYGYDEFIRRSPELSSAAGTPDSAPSKPAQPAKNGGRAALARAGSNRESAPRRFRLMLEELGPTFIKLGQVLSSRPDLISPAYVAELKTLQYQCEPLPFSDIRRALEAGLREHPDKLFQSIDPAPIATASIAQVHRGITASGEQVVIKVQRPEIVEEIRSDIEIMYRLAKFLDTTVEESQMAEPVGIVREFDRALTQELNFMVEAANLREFKQLHEGRTDIVIPTVYPDLSSQTVLTMSFLEGVPFTRLPADVDRKAIAERIVREAFDEVFVDGVFHADPHPGNLMLLNDGRYGILDLGVLGRLTPQMRETLIVLALAIAVRDADTIARTLYRLGHNDQRVSISAVRDDTKGVLARYLNRSIKDVDATVLLHELLLLAMKHRIRVPAEYTMLARAGGTIEGIVREFHPDIDVAKVATPYLERLLLDRVAPENVQGGLYKALLQFQGMSQDLPIQLSQILADLASGKFAVNVTGAQVERLNMTILMAATVMAGAIIGGAFIVGTFVAIANVTWTVFGVPVAAVFGAVCAATLVFWVGVYAAIRPRLRKISLSRYLKPRPPA
jgi:ubiquinone biosynthesis protein